jgi:hypothetical protein
MTDPKILAVDPLTKGTAQTDEPREPLVVELDPVGGGYPIIELPHRGVTIRTLQGAAARAHSEWPGRYPPDTFKLRLKGVIIGTITIKPS